MSFTKSLFLLMVIVFAFSLNTIAQRPKKIFKYLGENQFNLAVQEYDKLKDLNQYDNDDKTLFKIASTLFQIDTNYSKYNPLNAILEFTPIYNLNDKSLRNSTEKFLEKFELNLFIISEKIHNEIYNQAKRINTVESYKNALDACSNSYKLVLLNLLETATYNRIKTNKNIYQIKDFLLNYPLSRYKTEIQILLERLILNNYKSINNIDSLNQFIAKFDSSEYKKEAIDFRDSLVLSKVPENYDSMLAFTKKYPDSKFKKVVVESLPNVLFKQIKTSDFNIDLCLVFKLNFNKDIRNHIIDSISFIRFKQDIENEYNFNTIVNKYIINKQFISKKNKPEIFQKMIISLILSDDETFENSSIDEKELIYNYFRTEFVVKHKTTFGFKNIDLFLIPDIDITIDEYYNLLNSESNFSNDEINEKKVELIDKLKAYYFEEDYHYGLSFTVIKYLNFYNFHCNYSTATSVNVSECKYFGTKNNILFETKIIGLNKFDKYIEKIAGKEFICMNDNYPAIYLKKTIKDGIYEYSYLIRGIDDPQCCSRYEFLFNCKINIYNNFVSFSDFKLIKWKDSENEKWNIIN